MSNTGKRRYIICYDISDKKRLGRVARYCVKHALRLQYSVYEAHLTRAELRHLVAGLKKLINEGEDDLRVYGAHENAEFAQIGQSLDSRVKCNTI